MDGENNQTLGNRMQRSEQRSKVNPASVNLLPLLYLITSLLTSEPQCQHIYSDAASGINITVTSDSINVTPYQFQFGLTVGPTDSAFGHFLYKKISVVGYTLKPNALHSSAPSNEAKSMSLLSQLASGQENERERERKKESGC